MLQINSTDKLYVVVRSDLLPGQQASQICHALVEFSLQHREIYENWQKNSNYICLLQIENEQQLFNLSLLAKELHINGSLFREPDYDNSLTAIAFEPGKNSKKLLQKLKLAFK